VAAGAPLIPEGALGIAALADLLIALLDLLALGVLLGLLWVYRQTLGALIQFLVSHTTLKVFGVKIPFLFPLEAADNFLQASMSTAALGLEIAAGRLFHSLGVIFGWMVNLALYSATTLEGAVNWFKHIHLPRYAKWAIRAAFPLAWLTKLIAQEIAKVLPKIGHVAKGLAHAAVTVVTHPVRAIEAEIAKIRHKVAALVAAIAATGGLVIHPGHTLTLPKTWRALTKRLARIERRLHKAESWAAAGVLAVAMANVLGVTAKCLRSGNVGKVARRLCGLSAQALEDLLGLIADALILANICQVITLLQDGLSFIEPEIKSFIDAVETWACYGNAEHPPSLPGVTLDLPALVGVGLDLP